MLKKSQATGMPGHTDIIDYIHINIWLLTGVILITNSYYFIYDKASNLHKTHICGTNCVEQIASFSKTD